jgi:hypothetical protein
MEFELLIFDPNPDVVAALNQSFHDASAISVQLVKKMLYLEPPRGIDALYLPLAAAERWGAKPLVHDSQVLATSDEDQRKGLPPYIVTGTCLSPEDARGPVPEITLLLTSVFRAIKAFNTVHDAKLRRIGFWAYNLLKGLEPSELKAILAVSLPGIVSGSA